jgi:hypothetical protein
METNKQEVVMKRKHPLNNEKGSVIVLAVVMLFFLTMLGISATKTSSIEVQIAGNALRHNLAFYAAETSKVRVIKNPDLYGSQNIDTGTPHFFPNDTDPYVPNTSGLPTPEELNSNQSFNGSVEYDRSGDPPRGSGYEVGAYHAHNYKMICNGYSSHNTNMQIEVGFYRIGF